MPQMTPILIRLEPELLARIDALRGDVPRAAFIRRRLAQSCDDGLTVFNNTGQTVGIDGVGKKALKLRIEDVRPAPKPGALLNKGKAK